MEKNPFTFSASNPRWVENSHRSPHIWSSSAFVWFSSMYYYNKWYFRKDKNFLYLVGFAALSVPCALGYGFMAFGSSNTEAAIMNNKSERTK